jgi:hypothetical protein
MELDEMSGELTDMKFELFLSGHDRFKLNLVVLLAPVAELGHSTLPH